MPNPLQQAGALADPSNFAPLHTNRIFTGLWSNRSPLRDAATNDYQEHFGMGRQDSILDGTNAEISPQLTLKRRAGHTVYNSGIFAPVKRFYSFHSYVVNTEPGFGNPAGTEVIRVLADTPLQVLDLTGDTQTTVFDKTLGAGGTYFLGVGNTLYFTNGVDNKQWLYDPASETGPIFDWGIIGPTVAPVATQDPGATGTAPVQYGFAFMNSATTDISNMSPPSNAIMISPAGASTSVITGGSSTNPGDDTVVLYRTAQGGSTFLELATFPNPAGGAPWTYNDTSDDSQLNTEWQAQRAGEGTPLPKGAGCLGYHLSRIFAAVGNVVWISSGPDATVGGSSGNAGFDTQLVAQSKITRFWACSLGMVVFTVRDAYIILGSATDADPLYMVVFIEDLPLRSYDCFAVNKTTPFLLLGDNSLVSLDPSAGIVEVGFPIADRLLNEMDPNTSYVTFHKQSSLDTALYVTGAVATLGAGNGHWYRMNNVNAPESGSAWSPPAFIPGFPMGCVQSVEVSPGQYRLLVASSHRGNGIMQRDRTVNTDAGTAFPVSTTFGSIVLAQPGQLAALTFITLESRRVGTRAALALLLGEISGTFESLNRSRQDPPILPPSSTLFSDRYYFDQNQQTAWCRHFQMQVSWPAEDAANELLTFTIFGETWQEKRSQ